MMTNDGRFMTTAVGGLLAALLLAGPAAADTVTVTEGATAQFTITVAPKYHNQNDGRSAHIRLWYDTDGGTAVEGEDYAIAHSWQHHVRGVVGQPLTIAVETFADDIVEGDETFNIRLRKLQVQVRGRWGHSAWRTVPASAWKYRGIKTATILDATPHTPATPGSYEAEKYGPNYSGTVGGE